jgi:hypothetical protein
MLLQSPCLANCRGQEQVEAEQEVADVDAVLSVAVEEVKMLPLVEVERRTHAGTAVERDTARWHVLVLLDNKIIVKNLPDLQRRKITYLKIKIDSLAHHRPVPQQM